MPNVKPKTVRLDPDELSKVEEMAKARKVSESVLMASFIREGLRNETLLHAVLDQEFANLRRESIVTQTLACTSIAAALQLGVTLLEKNPGETDEAFTARKKSFLDSSLQHAFRLGNQVFDIQQASRRSK